MYSYDINQAYRSYGFQIIKMGFHRRKRSKLSKPRFQHTHRQINLKPSTSQVGGYVITPADLNTLKGQRYLNDTVIAAAIHRLSIMYTPNKIHTDPHICPQLVKHGKTKFLKSKAGRRFVESIHSASLSLFPINYKAHWALLVLDRKRKTLELLDSFTRVGLREFYGLRLLRDAIMLEIPDLLQPSTPTPQQTDTSSCGLYVISFAEAIIRQSSILPLEDPQGFRSQLEKALRVPTTVVANGITRDNIQITLTKTVLNQTLH